MEKKVQLVTGAAGFIGHKVSQLLLERGDHVIGIDNLNNYYDVNLKNYRLETLKRYPIFSFYKIDIENLSDLRLIFGKYKFSILLREPGLDIVW